MAGDEPLPPEAPGSAPGAPAAPLSVAPPDQPQLGRATERIIGIQRGMIFWATVTPREARGSEQNHQGPSPWLIISRNVVHNRMPIALAVPLTSQMKDGGDHRHYRIRIRQTEMTLYKLPPGQPPMKACDSLALTEQTRVIAHERIVGGPLAMVAKSALANVEAGVKFAMHFA